MAWQFVAPRVLFGEDALDELPEVVRGTNIVVVTDATLVKLGVAGRVVAPLRAAGHTVTVFSELAAEPDLPAVERCLEVLRDAAATTVVALGGGSAMDCAKAACALYARPDLTLDAITPFERLPVREKVCLVAVPTTSGTGADATWAIVVTDPADGRKLALANRDLVPEFTILDASLVKGLPPKLTAGTGFDVITHAIEAYTSTWRNDFTDPLALAAAELALTHLERAVRDGADAGARERMHNAATLAGLAFGNSQVGLVHSIGHAVGAVFHVHHGTALAVALPHVIRWNAEDAAASERYAMLARKVGVAPATAEGLAAAVEALRSAVGLPGRYRDHGIAGEPWAKEFERVVDLAMNDPCTIPNAREPTSDDVRKLVDACY